MRKVFFLLVIGYSLQFNGCSSTEQITTLDAEERFTQAKNLFDEENFQESMNEFTIVTLQYQGSSVADDAQFYLGECRFARGEFLLAVFEYQQLKRSYPASPLVPSAQFKLGLAYYSLSPGSALDQQYTNKAIDELQTFIEYYPSHDKASEADSLIRELTTRLARKSYEIAEQYVKLEYYKAAMFYFDDVIGKYHDTEYAPLAYLGKVEAFIAKKKYAEAQTAVDEFIGKFPNSVLRSRADQLRETVIEKLGGTKGLSGEAAPRDENVHSQAASRSQEGH